MINNEGKYGLERGLVGWWRLMDTNEGVNDIIGDNDGTLEGGVGYSSSGGRRYAVFDGTDDYVELAATEYVDINSFSMWIKPDGLVTKYPIAASYNDGVGDAANWAVELNRTAEKISFLQNSGTVALTSTGSLTTGWHHVAITRDGIAGNWTIKCYIDGALDTTASGVSANSDGGSIATSIGRYGNHATAGYFYGALSDFRIYNRTLSATEIARLAKIY